MKRLVQEKYRLELRWSKALYSREGVVSFKNAYFSGPCLQNAAQIASNDSISLDMSPQHRVFIPNFYIASLFWAGVKYKREKVFLDKTTLIDKLVNATPKLKDDDYFLIDTSDHEEEQHPYNIVYYCEVRSKDGSYYNHRDKVKE